MYGKKYFGISRTTLLIDKQRKIINIWTKVKPKGHAKEILSFIKEFHT
jgi:peroxiredoxin Q/BCP